MDGFLDWYCYCCDFNSDETIDIIKCYENLEYRNNSSIFNTVILFKKNNELYRENINAMYNVYNILLYRNIADIVNIDVYKYIKCNTLSYDDFVKKFKNSCRFIQFLINNLEYKPCDVKIALKD